jgi:hypothetical protein
MELKQIGRYEIQRRLGKGGMGSLYLARDPGLDRLVAIKLLKEDYLEDQEFRERFSREARARARLRHPNIVVVYDFGEHDGRPFMAMEYIDGETLRQRLARTPPLKLALGLAIVEDLCAGLASAHDAGIVHRDIKPDNIMMDQQGVLKLLDFGIARNAHAESTHQMTQPGMIMGTYNYMSPEQLLGEMVDKRSDIFAVGAVLYQVIAREQAFPGAFGAVYHRVLTAGPIPLEERVPGVDPTLVGIVMRALERNPSDRYQDANDMRLALSRARRRLADRSGAEEEQTVVVPRSPSARRQRDSEAKRGLIAEQLRLGHEAFARGDFDIALQYGERASFVDADDAAALELINKSRVAIDAKSVLPLLKQATQLLSQNRIQEALAKVEEASAGVPDLMEAQELRSHVQAVLDRIVSARERESRINTSLERARYYFDRAEYDTALRAVYEVLALDPDRRQARELEQHAKTQLQAQREREQAKRDAYERLEAAQALAAQGQFEEATAALNAIVAPSDTVVSALVDAKALVERLQRQARAAAAVADAQAVAADGDFERALTIIEAIPADDLTESAREVRADALESLAQRREREEKQERLQALDREAADAIEKARQLFTSHPQDAVTLLERSGSSHPDVLATLDALRGKLAEIEERAAKERERQAAEEEARRAEKARLAAEAEAKLLREQQRFAAEQQRLENEARELEQTQIATARQHLEHRARGQDQDQLDAERGESFQETIVRPPAIREEREQTRVGRREDKERPAPRVTIVLVAVALAIGIGVAGYRAFIGSSTESTTVVDEAIPAKGPEIVETPGPAVEADKPIDVPAPSAPDVTNVEARGTVVLDALPWAEVVSIVDERGIRREIPANSYTPLTLTLPGGDYEVTFRNGSTRTANVRITNDRVSRIEPIDFGKVDAAEYFQRQGWP